MFLMSVVSPLPILAVGLVGEEGTKVELGRMEESGGQQSTSEPWADSSPPVPMEPVTMPATGHRGLVL